MAAGAMAAEEAMAVRGAMMTWGWGCTTMGPLIITEAEAMEVEDTEVAGMEEARHPETGSEISRCVFSDL